MATMASPLKCVVVGDGAVGKTSLLMTYANNRFPEEYIPTVFDNYVATTKCNNQIVRLDLWDTAGQHEDHKLRPLAYPQTDIFLICFSLVDRNSLNNVQTIWLPEIRGCCPDTPIILVGTKCDLRENIDNTVHATVSDSSRPKRGIPSREGSELSFKIKALSYLECSALTQKGVNQIFDYAVRAILDPKSLKENGGSGGGKLSCCSIS